MAKDKGAPVAPEAQNNPEVNPAPAPLLPAATVADPLQSPVMVQVMAVEEGVSRAHQTPFERLLIRAVNPLEATRLSKQAGGKRLRVLRPDGCTARAGDLLYVVLGVSDDGKYQRAQIVWWEVVGAPAYNPTTGEV